MKGGAERAKWVILLIISELCAYWLRRVTTADRYCYLEDKGEESIINGS